MDNKSRNPVQLELELFPQVATELQEVERVAESIEKKQEERPSIRPEVYERTLDFIADKGNLVSAFQKVAQKGGSGGVDGMESEELMKWLNENTDTLQKNIMEGTFKPMPVRRVEIPKDNGKTRKLGIPTLIDRGVQMAICQVLSTIYEPTFNDNSFGFRPHRSAHDALKKCLEYANEGYEWVVDMDLEKYFDTVPQSKLLELISRTVKDGRVISLLYKFLKSGVMEFGRLMPTDDGVPQGGPLSPLLGNIMLNECDKELERRGLRFVRYADDMMIFCRTERSATRVMESITRFIEKKLKLKVNREKTVVRRITSNVKFLGYGFWKTNGQVKLKIHPKSIEKLKTSLKELLRRNNPLSFAEIKTKLKQKVEGWVRYFRYANARHVLQLIDAWMRHKIRCLIFKRSWRPRSRYAIFVKYCKASHEDAVRVANARQGVWAFSNHRQVQRWMSKELLCRAGYVSLLGTYDKMFVGV